MLYIWKSKKKEKEKIWINDKILHIPISILLPWLCTLKNWAVWMYCENGARFRLQESGLALATVWPCASHLTSQTVFKSKRGTVLPTSQSVLRIWWSYGCRSVQNSVWHTVSPLLFFLRPSSFCLKFKVFSTRWWWQKNE